MEACGVNADVLEFMREFAPLHPEREPGAAANGASGGSRKTAKGSRRKIQMSKAFEIGRGATVLWSFVLSRCLHTR